jgi:hypothetical protein
VWLYLCLREHFVWMSSIPITGLLRIRSWCHVQFLHLLNKQLFNNIFNHSSDLLLLCSVLKRMVYELYSRVGRFLTKIWFWIRVPLEYIHLYVKKYRKQQKKKFVGQVTFWGKVKHYIRVQNFFLIIWGLWVSKDAEFNVDSKNINLLWWQNAPKKSNSRKTYFNTIQYMGPPVFIGNSFFLNNFFLGAFCHWGQFIFLKSTLNSASLDTHWPPYYEKMLDPYLVLDPEKNNLFLRRSLDQNTFFCFRYFYIKMNKFQVFMYRSSDIDPPYSIVPYCERNPAHSPNKRFWYFAEIVGKDRA